MQIGPIDTRQRVLIVAEIGNNHEGNVDAARELVRRAAGCGADAVKFQTFRTEHFVRPSERERFERLKRFELLPAQFADLATLARSLGLAFISTPLDLPSAGTLEPMVDAFKIASGDATFYPLLERVARSGKPVILSSGASDLDEIRRTLSFVRTHQASATAERVAVLHCVSAYPVPRGHANLRTLFTLARELDCTIGYSDHTIGIDAAPLAVALGARIVEKHFTLDKHYSTFRDHQLSADPDDMRTLVQRIRTADDLLGSDEKTVRACESPAELRRSIVAVRDLVKDSVLTWSDIAWMRPAGGLPPGDEARVIGKILKTDVAAGDRLLPSNVHD